VFAAVLKHHMIKGHRCDVRKALSREEMRDPKFSGRGRSRHQLIVVIIIITTAMFMVPSS